MRTYTIRAKKGEDLRNPHVLAEHMSRLERLSAMPKKPSCSVSVEKLETVIRVLEEWVHSEHAGLLGTRGYDLEPDDYEELKLARALRRQVSRAKLKAAAKATKG